MSIVMMIMTMLITVTPTVMYIPDKKLIKDFRYYTGIKIGGRIRRFEGDRKMYLAYVGRFGNWELASGKNSEVPNNTFVKEFSSYKEAQHFLKSKYELKRDGG